MADLIVDGMEGLLSAFDDLAAELQRRQGIAVELAANEYKNDVQECITEIGLYKTGDYRRSVHVEPGIDSDGVPYALTGTDNIAAKQHEFGGVIKAKNVPYLMFKINGKWVKVKQVTQPAHPHFRPTLDRNAEKYQGMIVEEMFRDR